MIQGYRSIKSFTKLTLSNELGFPSRFTSYGISKSGTITYQNTRK
jgi:hypothetical protein